MPSISSLVWVLSVAFLAPAAAQTFTNCNPMERTDCPNNVALGTDYTFDFGQTLIPSIWNTTSGKIKTGPDGGEFTINKRLESPTVQTACYIFFGRVEVHMKAASGQGIISSIVLESDDLDEVDWEIIGGNNTHVETNYFGKGNTTSYDRAIYYPVDKPLESFHNYTVHWTSDAIEWWIDERLLRTLPYGEANGGKNFPQTPMNVRLGIWAGGDPDNSNGTIEWAGGITDFAAGPFTMYVKKVSISDFSTGKEYHYSDKSGSFQSIKSIPGNSSIASMLSDPAAVSSAIVSASAYQATATSVPTALAFVPAVASPSAPASASASTSASAKATASPAVAGGFSSLPSGVKIGIYSGAGACGAALLGFLIIYCIKQRRAGRAEQAAYDAKLEKERLDDFPDTMAIKHEDSLSARAPTPDEYDHGSADYTRAGSAGYGGGFYEAPVPPIPSVPPPYSNGGLNNPRHFSGGSGTRGSGFHTPASSRSFSGNGYPFPSTQTQGGYENVGRSNSNLSTNNARYGNSGFNGSGARYMNSNAASGWNNAAPSSHGFYGNGYSGYQNAF